MGEAKNRKTADILALERNLRAKEVAFRYREEALRHAEALKKLREDGAIAASFVAGMIAGATLVSVVLMMIH